MSDVSNLSKWTQVEYHFDQMERVLTYISATVALAPVAGPLKFLMGTITTLSYPILSLYAHVTKDEEFDNRAYSLMKHGVGNMAAGVAETLPFVGLGSLIHRFWRNTMFNMSRGDLYVDTHDQDKYMPYPSIARLNFEITNGVEGRTKVLKYVKTEFQTKYPDSKARDQANLEEMRKDVTLFEKKFTEINPEKKRF